MVRKSIIILLLGISLLAQPPEDLVKKCTIKIENFALSKEILPRLAIDSIKNHSLRSQAFLENLYELLSSNLKDYLIPTEGVLGFDQRGGFFSPPPGYDYLLRFTYREIAGDAYLIARIYSKKGTLEDFISCSARVEEIPYREFEQSSLTPSTPQILWDAQVEGMPLAAMKNGEDIFILYFDKLVKYKKVGGVLKMMKTKALTWPPPFYPSQDLRGFIGKVSLEDGLYINIAVSSSATSIYLKYSDLTTAMLLPWIVLYQGEDQIIMGKFSPGKNYFSPTLARITLPASLQQIASPQEENFPPFYDMCLWQGMINFVDETGTRRIFKEDQQIPSPQQRLGDEMECWGDYFVYTGFDGKEKIGYQSFTSLEKRGSLVIGGKVIFMSHTEEGSILVLEQSGGKYWIKEIRIE